MLPADFMSLTVWSVSLPIFSLRRLVAQLFGDLAHSVYYPLSHHLVLSSKTVTDGGGRCPPRWRRFLVSGKSECPNASELDMEVIGDRAGLTSQDKAVCEILGLENLAAGHVHFTVYQPRGT